MLVTIKLVIPIGVAVINPLLLSVADILDNPRTVRILGLVVDTGEKLHHISVRVGGIFLSGVRHPELIDGIYRPVTTILVVS